MEREVVEDSPCHKSSLLKKKRSMLLRQDDPKKKQPHRATATLENLIDEQPELAQNYQGSCMKRPLVQKING
ncbi:hypothetical protein E2562_017065 [Oryza meyeriana var. granulata]|uniref:Uncharacterized protein n=1 Tax=Oryza meyeriana var. granulata TaxID=110450 RepID=A0A6G1F8M5_9ORYZ|nr:hypothetical protein E2562_017065 [Oryza meyeriana var. granulata]